MRNFFVTLAFTASIIPAAASASNYSANLIAAPTGNLVARDVLWSCGAGACSGATDYSRPLVVCQSLAKKVGRVDSFRVNGQPLAAAELERCNASAKAKGDAAAPVASGN
ncbi:MAG: hypothetical protein ABIO29_04645 [Sphingomicrobium sp.]